MEVDAADRLERAEILREINEAEIVGRPSNDR
jgi:hypothetical protein